MKKTQLPSAETLKQALLRALETCIISAGAALTMIPANFTTFEGLKSYGYLAAFALLTGFISGLYKFIKGYVKYDRV